MITNPAKESASILSNMSHLDDRVELKIDRSDVADHIMTFIEETISSHMPFLATNLQELREVCIVAEEVLRKSSLKSKSISLKLLGNYLETVMEIRSETDLIVSILSSLSVITRDLNFLDGQIEAVVEFVSTTGEFFRKISEHKIDKPSRIQMIEMTKHCRFIITNLQNQASADRRLENLASLKSIVTFLETILETNSIDEDIVENLRSFESNDEVFVFNLLRYPVSVDILGTSANMKNVRETSSTWNKVQRQFTNSVYGLTNLQSVEFISKSLEAAYQTFKKVEQLHMKIHHAIENDDICSFCHTSYSNHQNNQYLGLQFFDTSSDWLQILLDFIKQDDASRHYDRIIITTSSLLRLHPKLVNLDENNRNSLIATLASPFHKTLKNHRIMVCQPQNIKDFFMRNNIVAEDYMQMKTESVELLSQMTGDEFSSQIILEILQSIDKGENSNEELKKCAMKNLMPFLANNSVLLESPIHQTALGSILKSFTTSENFPIKEILCWTGGNMCMGQISCISTNVTFKVHCSECDQITILEMLDSSPTLTYPHSGSLEINENLLKDLVDSYLTNVNKDSLGMFSSIITHSKFHKNQLLMDNGKKHFETVIVANEIYLELLVPQFQRIIETALSMSQSQEQFEKIIKCCHDQLFLLTAKCIYQNQEELQKHTLDLIRVFLDCIPDSDEINIIHAFVLILNYLIVDKSTMKTVAAMIIFEITRKLKISFENLLGLQKTYVLSKLAKMLMYNISYSRTASNQVMIEAFSEVSYIITI